MQRRSFLKLSVVASLFGSSPSRARAASLSQSKQNNSITALDYMTKEQQSAVRERTGAVDVTNAINTALNRISSGGRIFFPAGTYACNLNAITLRNAKQVEIVGEGESTILKPTHQASSQVKQTYHTTFAVDNCSGVTIENMTIESKGENYGDTDAGSIQATGEKRAEWAINKGGHALLVCRSTNIRLRNVTARRCGSVGVFYVSSCEDIEFENCFANARSLGYAGFAVDNWVSSASNPKRNYKFINCSVAKEDARYSSKGCIAIEGDNGKIISVEIIGGEFCDAAIGPDAPTYGTGITATDCSLVAKNIVVKNCYIGIRLNKRGGVSDFLQWSISDASLLGNRVSGIYLIIGSPTGGGRFKVNNVTIQTESISPWSSREKKHALEVTSGVVNDGYMAGAIDLENVSISGSRYGVLGLDQSQFNIYGGKINAISGGVMLYGGGTNRIKGVAIKTSGMGSHAVYCNTQNQLGTASRYSKLYVEGSTLRVGKQSNGDAAIRLTGNSALFKETVIKRNQIVGGTVNAPKGSATLYDVDDER